MNPDTKHRFTPLLIAIGTIAGIFIGSFYSSHFSGGRINIINTGSNKVGYLLQLIDNIYVDTVDMNSLVEDAMPLILSELDPHSSYFGPKDAEEANESLKGSFSGIGVQFCADLMPFAGGISHLCEAVDRDESNPLAVMFADKPITAVLGMCSCVSNYFEKLHAGKHCVDLADFIADTSIVTIVRGKGKVVVSSVAAHEP